MLNPGEENIKFSLHDHMNTWLVQLKSEPSITESDAEELKSHLLDMIDGLRNAGLSEEEAFWVASKRMGRCAEWKVDYEEMNKPHTQLRRSLFLLAGVLAYFLFYYFIKCSSKLLFIVLVSQNIDGYLSVNWVYRYLIGVHFVFILFVVSIFLLEKKTVELIEHIKMKPRQMLFLLITTVLFCLTDTCLYPIAKNLIGKDLSLRSQFYHLFFYFDYSFPLMVCTGFIVLYFKYYKKSSR